MNYFRRIEKPLSELKYKMQIGALLLNINKNKIDIESLKNNELEQMDKIKQNEKDIVSILKQQVYYNKFYFNTIEIKNNNTGLIKIMNIPIKYSFSNNNYTIEINASYKYSSSYKRKNFNNIYQFYNNNSLFKYISKNHKDSYNGNLIIDNFQIKLANYTNNISLNIHLESILIKY